MMKSCHEEGVRDRNRSCRDRHLRKTNGKEREGIGMMLWEGIGSFDSSSIPMANTLLTALTGVSEIGHSYGGINDRPQT
eukprot:gene19137-biopygen5880